jgi:hypothetical protein
MSHTLSFCQVVLQPDLQVRQIGMNDIPQNLEGVGQEVVKRQKAMKLLIEAIDRSD